MKRIGKDKFLILLIILLVVDLSFRAFIAFSNSLYGDGALHTYLAKQMVENRTIYSHFPHWIVEVTNGNRVYFPVAYPQLDYFILAFSYLSLAENGVKFSNVLLGTLSVLMVFLLTERIVNKKAALIATVLIAFEEALYSNMVAFYMESALTFFSLGALLFYVMFLQSQKNRDLWITMLFLGLCIAVKQQGLLIYLALISFHFTRLIWHAKESFSVQSRTKLQGFFLLVAIPLVLAAPFIIYQLSTTGTLFYPPVPEFSRIIFKPKWVEDPVAFRYIENLVTPTIWTLDWIIQSATWFVSYYPGWLNIVGIVLLLLGIIWIFMKQRQIFTLFFFVVTIYAAVFILVNPLPRYYLILRILASVVGGIGVYGTLETSPRKKITKRLTLSLRVRSTHTPKTKWLKHLSVAAVLLFLVIFPAFIRATDIHAEYYKISDRTSGGRWPDRVARIADACKWLNEHTLESDTILIGRFDEAMFYLERNVMWITALGGRDIPNIFSSLTAWEALGYLQRYNITYVWMDQLQFSSGYVDKIPEHGLVDFVDISPFFVKMYQNDFVRIYKVTALSGALSISYRHYYSNIFGDDDDIYQTSPITLSPPDRWRLSTASREGISNNRSYAEIKVIADEFNTENEYSQVPATLALYFYDSFWTSVDIYVLNCSLPSTWQKLTTLYCTDTSLLKSQTIQVQKPYLHESKIVLAFDIHGEAFPLKAILFLKGDLTPAEKNELDGLIVSLPPLESP